MKLRVYKSTNGYYIAMGLLTTDYNTAHFLNITVEEYRDILKTHSAQPMDVVDDHYFEDPHQANLALTHLESYHIMKELTEE
jgi:hypothetical protein